jgi:predicted  nucleic acid-binding Zn-ribbon protein
MNTFTSPETQEINRLEKLRAQIAADVEAMQEKERGLREYEQRLRALVEMPQQSQSAPSYPHRPNSTPPVDANLDAEWEKYQRAHALLEAARRGLTDDRLALKARETDLLRLEEQLSRREAWIKVRERELDTLEKQRQEVKAPAKARSSFTQAPFMVVMNLLTGES